MSQFVSSSSMDTWLRRRVSKHGWQLLANVSEKCVISTLNFDAKNYTDLIDWQNTDVTELPLLEDISVDELEMLVASGETPVTDFPRYPCHTQAVERTVKLVTEASTSVCGEKAKDGFIRVRLEPRKL